MESAFFFMLYEYSIVGLQLYVYDRDERSKVNSRISRMRPFNLIKTFR